MTSPNPPPPPWARRAIERSVGVHRSRDRAIEQATRIIDAAFAVIDEKGSAFTVKDVATKAHIALQTFYRHFSSRDELMLALFEQTVSESAARYRDAAAHLTDPLERLRLYITAVLSSLDDPSLARRRTVIIAEHHRVQELHPRELTDANRHFTDLLIPEIRAAAALGRLAPNDIETDAWHVTTFVMASYHHHSFSTGPPTAAEIGDSVWQFCLRALGGQPSVG